MDKQLSYTALQKPHWRPMLDYVRTLHVQSTLPPQPPFSAPWEHIGTGYCYGPAFGHWDIVHQILDLQCINFEHARLQLRNALSLQLPNGMLPSILWMRSDSPTDWKPNATHPPVWVFAAEALLHQQQDAESLQFYFTCLQKQLHWFQENRCAQDGGYYYTDSINRLWESGVDEGVRFLDAPCGKFSCIDATSHVYALSTVASKWAQQLAQPQEAAVYAQQAQELRELVQNDLFDEKTGFFFDSWAMVDLQKRHLTFEGMWPLLTGAATQQQAHAVIENYLLNPKHFFTRHPIATVAVSDTHYEKRMWHGPAWNSMTYWAAFGCYRYGEYKAAATILEAALNSTAEIFAQTGCIWEFYDSLGALPQTVQRKPQTQYNQPCKDYLGPQPAARHDGVVASMHRGYDSMQYLTEKLGVPISRLALGCSVMGTKISQQEAFSMLDYFTLHGGTCIDTARSYANWLEGGADASEKTIGAWLRAKPHMRSQICLASKGGLALRGANEYRADLSYQTLHAEIETSLALLHTDYLDLFWLHRDDARLSVEEIMQTCDRLRRSGRVRHIGASNWTVKRICEANDYAHEHHLPAFVASQIQFSLPICTPAGWGDETIVCMNQKEFSGYCTSRMPVFCYSSQGQGFLPRLLKAGLQAMPQALRDCYACEENLALALRLQQWCRQQNATASQAGLDWLLSAPFPAVAILGCGSLQRLKQVMPVKSTPFSKQAFELLRGNLREESANEVHD